VAPEKSPAFQFYPKDFLSDERVRLMSHAELGVYITLLCLCWCEQSLPNDPRLVAKLVHQRPDTFQKIWEHVVKSCFYVAEDGRLRHKRLDEERLKQEEFSRRQSTRSAARWDKKKDAAALRTPQSLPPQCSSSSSSSAYVQKTVRTAAALPDARSKRPIFQGTRFAVFEWQHDDLCRMLGSHMEAFRLDEWYHDLNATMSRSGEIIPQRDGGAWLQARTLEEAQRRGLPIAAGKPAKPELVSNVPSWEATQAYNRRIEAESHD
jgi:uncharacterized protein YdaU (DUF1376 family)